MRVNTNVNSLVAYRNLSTANAAVSDSMAKLSTGFRINKAADDAAGLGIANKLRADNRALQQASRNAEQANSVLQIAEGATSTIQKMLERMKELATQAGSNSVDDAGRKRINEEFKQLSEEITRTVDTTKFQGTQLLKQNLSKDAVTAADGTGSATGATGATAAASIDFTATTLAAGKYTISDDGTDITLKNEKGDTVATAATGAADAEINFSSVGLKITLGSGYDKTDAAKRFDGTQNFTVTAAKVDAADAVVGDSQSFLIGSSGQYADGKDALSIDGFNLELSTLKIDKDSLETLAGARTALANIDSAMDHVNETLGKIGANQNRIQYAQDNLKTTIVNFSAAESVIRDLDMADEMTKFSKNNIISQAATAMLAQANQSTQGVLQLLRG